MQLKCPHCGVLLTGREGDTCRFCGEHLSPELMAQVREARAVYGTPRQDGFLDPGTTAKMPRIDINTDTRSRSYVAKPIPQKRSRQPLGLMLLVGVLAVAVVAGLAGFATGAISLPDLTKGTGQPSQAAVESPQDASDDSAGQAQDEPSVTVEPKASLSDYSWAELSAISSLIAACETEADAYALAGDYNLVGKGGALNGDKIKVTLLSGESFKVRLIGIYHDHAPDGSMAGLTFCTTAPVEAMAMTSDGSNQGGWKDSAVRSYLSEKLYPLLPAELADSIVAVEKLSNNQGMSTKKSCVSATEDLLWIPSFVECVGPITSKTLWYKADDVTNYNIYNEEGSQYAYFADLGVKADDPADGALVYALDGQDISWWMRTATPSTTNKFHVSGADGDQTVSDEASAENGVVFGFCL